MKKFKKILSAVSAAVLCALPMINGVAANAEDESDTYRKTYRIYYDVPEKSEIRRISFCLDFNNMKVESTKVGNLGGNVQTGQVQTPNYMEYGGNYQADGVLISPGTAFIVKILAADDFDSCIVKNSTSAFDNSLKLMSNNPVKTEVVFVGDANGDGIISISDVVSISSYVANPSSNPLKNLRAADANGDGVVTKDDATMVQQYLAQVISHF